MGAELVIKDADGTVILNLSSRITRFTIDYTAVTSASGLLPKQVIKIGNKADRGSYWFLTRFSKTAYSDNPYIEGGCYPSFGVYMCDKNEIANSGFAQDWINSMTSQMDDNSFYIVIVDTRQYVKAGYQNSVTVDVGKF